MNWVPPTVERLYDVIDTTWPPSKMEKRGPFRLRRGDGGGQRVSAASLFVETFTEQDVNHAERLMDEMQQPRLFMILDGDNALDVALEQRGYFVKDPVTLFAAPSVSLSKYDPKGLKVIDASEPMAVMAEIWETGGIGVGRLDVMRRAADPKACFLGRMNDQPSAVAYVGCDDDIAMLHALEVLPKMRQKGLALNMMGASAAWAMRNGADTFSVVVLTENNAACGLYAKMGMVKVGSYHYRKKEIS